MRNIKFRVWDEETSNMYKGNEVIFAFRDELEEVYVIKDKIADELIDYKLMKSTGLTDIKVNEIYENDIIQCNGNKEDLQQVKFGKFPLRDFDTDEIVEFVIGWYFIILENDKLINVAPFCYPVALNDYWINKLNIEVVGNIYENQELLD